MSRFVKLTDGMSGEPVWISVHSIVSVEACNKYRDDYRWGARTSLFLGDFEGCTQTVRETPEQVIHEISILGDPILAIAEDIARHIAGEVRTISDSIDAAVKVKRKAA